MRLVTLTYQILLIIIFAIGLPQVFDLLIIPELHKAKSFYSDVDNQFYILHTTNSGRLYTNQNGKEVSKLDYEAALPFMYFQRLYIKGELPDSLGGLALTPDLIGTTNKIIKISARAINHPPLFLFPLSYQNLKADNIENIFLTFNDRLEIINPVSNSIIEDITNIFNKKLNYNYFRFPAKRIFGRNSKKQEVIPEGVFIVDANNHFYNLYFNENTEPVVRIIPLPEGVQVKKMFNTVFNDLSTYGIIIDQNDNIYNLESNNYNLIHFPIDEYNSTTDDIIWAGNVLTTTINIIKEDTVFAFAFKSDNGELIAKTQIEITKGNRHIIRQWKATLFPFILKTKVPYSKIARLRIENSPLFLWLINCAISIIVYIIILYFKKRKDWFGFVLVALTGLYGLISCLLVKPHDKA